MPIEIDTEAEGLALLDEATTYYYEERRLKNREIKNKPLIVYIECFY